MAEQTDSIENATIHLLQEMRAEMTAGFGQLHQELADVRTQVAVLAQNQNGMRNDIHQIKLHIQEIAIIIDHHGRRLDAIEHHLGLGSARH